MPLVSRATRVSVCTVHVYLSSYIWANQVDFLFTLRTARFITEIKYILFALYFITEKGSCSLMSFSTLKPTHTVSSAYRNKSWKQHNNSTNGSSDSSSRSSSHTKEEINRQTTEKKFSQPKIFQLQFSIWTIQCIVCAPKHKQNTCRMGIFCYSAAPFCSANVLINYCTLWNKLV